MQLRALFWCLPKRAPLPGDRSFYLQDLETDTELSTMVGDSGGGPDGARPAESGADRHYLSYLQPLIHHSTALLGPSTNICVRPQSREASVLMGKDAAHWIMVLWPALP